MNHRAQFRITILRAQVLEQNQRGEATLFAPINTIDAVSMRLDRRFAHDIADRAIARIAEGNASVDPDAVRAALRLPPKR